MPNTPSPSAAPRLPGADIRRLWPSDMPLFRDSSAAARSGEPAPAVRRRHVRRLRRPLRRELLRQGRSRVRRLRRRKPLSAPRNCVPARRSGPSRRRFSAMSTPRRRSASSSDYRRRGIGEQLFRRIQRGREQPRRRDDRDRLHARQRRDDSPGPKFKAHFTFEENMYTGRLTARRPTAFSMLSEIPAMCVDFTTSMFDMQMRARSAAAERFVRGLGDERRLEAGARAAREPDRRSARPAADGEISGGPMPSNQGAHSATTAAGGPRSVATISASCRRGLPESQAKAKPRGSSAKPQIGHVRSERDADAASDPPIVRPPRSRARRARAPALVVAGSRASR